MAKRKQPVHFLRPASEFPTPLFLITLSFMAGWAIGAWVVLHYIG